MSRPPTRRKRVLASTGASLAVLALMFGPSTVTAGRTAEAVREVLVLYVARFDRYTVDIDRAHRGSFVTSTGQAIPRTCAPVVRPAGTGWVCAALTPGADDYAAMWLARTPDGPVVSVRLADDDPATEPNP